MGLQYKRTAIIAGLGSWTDIVDSMTLILTVPLIAVHFKLTPTEVGLLIGISSLGMVLHGIFGGIMIDYFGRKRAFVIGNLLTGVLYFLSILAPYFMLFLILRLIAAIFFELTTTSANIIVAEEAPPQKRQWITGLSQALGVLGMLNMSFIVIIIGLFNLPWQFAFAYAGILDIIVATIGAIFLTESSLWKERKRLLEAEKIKEKVPLRMLLTPKFRLKFLLILVMSISIPATGAAYGLLLIAFPFMSTYMTNVLMAGMFFVGLCDAVSIIFSAPGRAIMGKISDNIGRLNTFIVCSILLLAGTQLCYRTHAIIGIGESLPVMLFFILFFSLYSWGWTSTGLTAVAWCAELFPTSIRGTVAGLTGIIAGLVSFFSSTIVGYLSTFLSLGEVLAAVSLMAILVLLAITIVSKKLGLETKGKTLEA